MHQISEIRTNSNIKDWHFINGALNVSDYCTQPLKFKDLAKPTSFLNGPKFLFEPLGSVFSKDEEDEEDEVIHNSLEINSNPVIVQKTVIIWDRYSSQQNLVRHIAYIKLMIRNWKIKKNRPKESFPLMLPTEILYECQNTTLELVQKDHFSVEHHNLKSHIPLSKRSKILPLAPILVANLIKVGDCIQHSNILDQQKHQIILPAAYYVTSLVVTHIHEKHHHCGRNQTLPSIRENFR